MKVILILIFIASFNLHAFELMEGQSYKAKSNKNNCDDFVLQKSKNPNTPSWLLGPSIVFFEPGFKESDRSNCMVDKVVEKQGNKWIQNTRAFDCEDVELGYSKVEKLEMNKKSELIYSSEITYTNQKNQVQRLSCRFVKEASKAN